MQFTISTAKINIILSTVAKGVGRKLTLPITEYLHINLYEKKLTVTSTDSNNFISYFDNEVEGTNGSAIVKADTLIKLVSKTTKETMTFTLKEGHLEVKGNGKYKVELLEEEEFPSYEFNDIAEPFEVETLALKKIFAINKSAIADDMIMPCLTGYNVGEKSITTDGITMCIYDVQIGTEPMLITQTLADLLSTMTSEKVLIQKEDNKLLFSSENIVIFGTELAGIEEYPDITPILDIQHDAMCIVPKAALLHAIDRLSLFVNTYDNSGIKLTFTTGSLILTDLKENSTEEIQMSEHVRAYGEDVTLNLNIDLFKSLLGALVQPTVKIEYGLDLPVKIEEAKVTLIISTMETE